jgi:hypothetical protein
MGPSSGCCNPITHSELVGAQRIMLYFLVNMGDKSIVIETIPLCGCIRKNNLRPSYIEWKKLSVRSSEKLVAIIYSRNQAHFMHPSQGLLFNVEINRMSFYVPVHFELYA